MKKTVGIIGALAILLGCFVNLAFATDVNMIPYEGTAKMEKVEITSETSVRLAEDEMPFFSRESESVRLTLFVFAQIGQCGFWVNCTQWSVLLYGR